MPKALVLTPLNAETARGMAERASDRVARNIDSAYASGVRFTPTFFIDGRRYDGPWDESSLTDAMLGSLGHRVRTAALTFASRAPSAGLLLLLATILAIALTNSGLGRGLEAFWHTELGFAFGSSGFRMPLLHWANDAPLTISFLIVGLDIEREFTVGHLARLRTAALPRAAAIGGLLVPALLVSVPDTPPDPGRSAGVCRWRPTPPLRSP